MDTVKVVTSPRITVPDVTGLTKGQAAMAVKKAGLTLGPEILEYNDTVPERLVISQSPVAGSVLKIGEPVDLTISLGVHLKREKGSSLRLTFLD